jgi:hypothetical protein
MLHFKLVSTRRRVRAHTTLSRLKCNRELPCDACTRRDKAAACTYASNAARNRPSNPKPRELKDRLNVLENLISSLLSGDAVIHPGDLGETEQLRNRIVSLSTPPSSSPGTTLSGTNLGADEALTPETPRLRETGDGQVNYIEPSHWLSILDDIKEVREHLSVPSRALPPHQTSVPDEEGELPDLNLLHVGRGDMGLAEIIESLPAPPICDTLLSWYFNSRFMILGIIHPVKFQAEYEAFRASPMTTSPLWIALLFSVLSITVCLRRVSGITEAEGSVVPLRVLQQRTVQCLILGRYSSANEYALEAFIFHMQSRFGSNDALPVKLWFDMGTIIRLAIRMGYHRDPRHLNGISTFDGEMRRRVWLNIFQIDALMSFQMGFPSMIPADFCDTEVPRNLEYADLQVDMTELPPSRPMSENTPVLYIIVKASVMAVFKKVAAHTQALTPPAYEDTMALDAQVRQAYSAVPEFLQRRDVNRSFIDHSCLIWQRCSIEILYLKSIIVLHRRYVSYELQTPKYEHSRRACIEAALDMLARQSDLHKACEPGGRLHGDRWMIFALPVSDFLLAAMVVCLDLSVRMRNQVPSGLHNDHQLTLREYRALQISHQIWTANSAVSSEAQIAALAVDLMLKRGAENHIDVPQDQEAPAFDFDFDIQLPYADSMSQMIAGSETIDWVGSLVFRCSHRRANL